MRVSPWKMESSLEIEFAGFSANIYQTIMFYFNLFMLNFVFFLIKDVRVLLMDDLL